MRQGLRTCTSMDKPEQLPAKGQKYASVRKVRLLVVPGITPISVQLRIVGSTSLMSSMVEALEVPTMM